MKKLTTIIACAILCIPILHGYAQTNPPKNDVKLFFEKVFVQTDRQIYTTGDDLWYTAYLVNAQDNRLLSTSKSLYIELINPGNKIISREMIALNNGIGKGDVQLPDSIPAGNYRLRAYTNWMRNFGDNFIFEKKITLVSSKTAAQPVQANAGTTTLRFFPEGGSMVEGLSSVVAMKAENATGKGLAAKGAVFSTTGDTVATFTTDTLGIGMFNLLPLPGQTYQAKAAFKTGAVTTKLPAPLANGLTLKIYKRDTTTYALITCNEQAVATYGPQTLTLKARSFGRVVFQQTLQLKGNTAAVALPTKQLPTGITSLTLYDGQQKPNCERLYYIDNPQNLVVKLTTNKTLYTPRERIALDVKTTDKQGKPLTTFFSLAAVDAAVVPAEETNITAYLMLQSELKGEIKNASRYFDTTNVQHAQQLDMLLLTQGWRDFIWKRLADTSLRIAYIPEQGISISGKVKLEKKDTPVAGANITLIAPKAQSGRLFSAQTNAQGNYYFDNLQLYGPQSLRINSKDAKGKPVGLLSLDSLAINLPPVNAINNSNYVTPSATSRAALIKQVTQAKQRSLSDTLIKLNDVQVKAQGQVLRDQTLTNFGYKDEVLTVKPDDYRYNTLRDYIQFASNQARVDAQTNRLQFYADGKAITPRIILNNRDALFTDNDPDDVIDLISNSYFDLPVTAIEKVVIRKMLGGGSLMVQNSEGSAAVAAAASMAATGRTAMSGGLKPMFVIYLTLKPGALTKKEPGALQAEVTGYYEARTFYKPMYNQPKADTRVDARATLHWEPSGSTVQNGHSIINFYNSDSKTTVRLVVQGVTSTGIPVTAIKTYKVQ